MYDFKSSVGGPAATTRRIGMGLVITHLKSFLNLFRITCIKKSFLLSIRKKCILPMMTTNLHTLHWYNLVSKPVQTFRHIFFEYISWHSPIFRSCKEVDYSNTYHLIFQQIWILLQIFCKHFQRRLMLQSRIIAILWDGGLIHYFFVVFAYEFFSSTGGWCHSNTCSWQNFLHHLVKKMIRPQSRNYIGISRMIEVLYH